MCENLSGRLRLHSLAKRQQRMRVRITCKHERGPIFALRAGHAKCNTAAREVLRALKEPGSTTLHPCPPFYSQNTHTHAPVLQASI